jgi:hypothetical protein
MRLKDYLEAYHEFSGKTSEVNRQLALAGIAAIWLFGGSASSQPTVAAEFVLPGMLFVASLACDLLQYLTASLIWKVFHRIRERSGIRPDEDVKAPSVFSHILEIYFYTKVALTVAGYAIVLVLLWSRM